MTASRPWRFLLVNLGWPGLVSKKTHKLHLALPPLDLLLLSNLAIEHGHEARIFDRFVEPGDNLGDQTGPGSGRPNPPGQLPPMDDLVVKHYDVDLSRYGYFLPGQRVDFQVECW